MDLVFRDLQRGVGSRGKAHAGYRWGFVLEYVLLFVGYELLRLGRCRSLTRPSLTGGRGGRRYTCIRQP